MRSSLMTWVPWDIRSYLGLLNSCDDIIVVQPWKVPGSSGSSIGAGSLKLRHLHGRAGKHPAHHPNQQRQPRHDPSGRHTFNYLGATITDLPADFNLGLKTYLNGTLASNIVIDTSQIATDTIDYVAIDQNGLTSTSTRTVIVEASSSIIPTDDAGPGSPTADNSGSSIATTTEATSTAQ